MKKLKIALLGYLAIALITFFPVLITFLAMLLGSCLGCNINEGATDPCIRMGIAFGEVLNYMAVLFWLFFFTFPLGIVLVIAWSLGLGIWLLLSARPKNKAKPQ